MLKKDVFGVGPPERPQFVKDGIFTRVGLFLDVFLQKTKKNAGNSCTLTLTQTHADFLVRVFFVYLIPRDIIFEFYLYITVHKCIFPALFLEVD